MGATTRLRAPKPSPIRLGAHWINVHEAGQLNTPALDNQAVVLPENIDAIRALVGTVTAAESIQRTDESLSIRQDFLPATEKTKAGGSVGTD